MDYEELTKKFKGDAGLLEKLNVFREQSGLNKLYLIYFSETEAIWGIRRGNKDLNVDQFLKELAKFIMDNLNVGYHVTQIKVFDGPVAEVDYLTTYSELGDYITGHGGQMTVDNVDEDTGVIEVTLSGSCSSCSASLTTMKIGILGFLKKLLPWVQKVKPTNEPEDPDFGIKETLEEALEKIDKEKEEKEGRER